VNPEQSCCTEPESRGSTEHRTGFLATAGAVVTAILSSACCWLPLLLIAFGASAAGVSSFFEAYRFWFLGATALLLATGFYLTYFRKGKCAPGSSCATPKAGVRKFNKVMLWVATAMVLVFGFFPNYVPILLRGTETDRMESLPSGRRETFAIDGMTCEACAITLGKQIRKVPGVGGTEVDYEKGEAIVIVPHGAELPREEIIRAVEAAGYRAKLEPRKAAKPMKRTVTVLHTEGCGNTPRAIALVKQYAEATGVVLTIEQIVVKTDEDVGKYKFIGSPTVRINGLDVDQTARSATQFGFT